MNSFIAITLIVAATAVPPLSDGPEYEPLNTEAYTEDLELAGFDNGYMPDLRMIEVEGCLLERDAAYSLAVMLEAAAAEGVDLDPGDCYRSYEQQSAAYNERCPLVEQALTTYDPVTDETTTVAYTSRRECSGPPIAEPGKSNHGWGRAIDFTRDGRSTIGCGDEDFDWLNANGPRFGWVHPAWAHCGQSTQEPWHWEWGGVVEVEPPVIVPIEPDLHRLR